MDLTPAATELDAALLQLAITLGLVALFGTLHRRYRKPYLGWWTVAWVLFTLRIGAIVTFIVTEHRVWLFVHQVLTGWTALAVLWATLLFAGRAPPRRVFGFLVAFPPLWSAIAIYQLDTFLLAAGPAVAFLSGATLAAGVAFIRFRRQTGSTGALVLGGTLLLWGIHHLDYPLLRARGAWTPWGYYLDIVFLLAMGSGTLLLVVEELRSGIRTLSAMTGDLHRGAGDDDALDALLRRPLELAAVHGAAYLDVHPLDGPETESARRGGTLVRRVRAAGVTTSVATDTFQRLAEEVARSGRPSSARLRQNGAGFVLALPVFRDERVVGVLAITGGAADPFTALDEDFLLTLGRQVGAAMEREDLQRHLRQRTADLEQLSVRLIREHESIRRRLSLELHDETAQAFSALKLQLGNLRDLTDDAMAPRIDRLVELVDAGMRSIRSVTDDLRPSVLDDLGLVPALRALTEDFAHRTGIAARFTAGGPALRLGTDAELAIYRALQEGLSNAARHAAPSAVEVLLASSDHDVALTVIDDGRGLGDGEGHRPHVGLAGMQERIAAEGGTVTLRSAVEGGGPGGAILEVRVPMRAG